MMSKSEMEMASEKKDSFSSPIIALPKGGGAIKGIGEKFAANPVNGTGSMSVPIATSPGRSGFGPQLMLSYDSGAGNGPFGFGWNLSLPSITRKTDKGLPQYRDAEETDVFILSGSEDLVPVFKKDEKGNCIYDSKANPLFDENDKIVEGYLIRFYRPRIEGLFARIERWTNLSNGDVHWRSLSKDNILTIYGKDNNSRIVAADNQTHIFSWLISETRDDKGNAIVYEYKEEDSANVNLSQIHEGNRGGKESTLRKTNRYLKHIYYGNQQSLLDEGTGQRPHFLNPSKLAETKWMFEVVFDYGEHSVDNPTPSDTGGWLCRHDSFSSYRAGFEVRTYRLCQRILMFHHFPDEKEVGQDCLVRSTDFVYRNTRNNPEDSVRGHPVASFIASITQSGYKRLKEGYLKKSFPPLEFEYSEAIVQEKIESIDKESLENLPVGVDGKQYQWLDLFGDGVSGIFTEQGDGWFYKRNLSPGQVVDPSKLEKRVQFGPLESVAQRPKVSVAAGNVQFMDLAGDGELDVVMLDSPTPGFFEVNKDEQWEPFQAFKSRFNYSSTDPNLKFIDLNGDGHADALITEEQVFTWFPSLAEEGFGAPHRVTKPIDEEKGPAIVFADPTQSIYLADMSGDGLTDIVRIRNGEICYWPNLGYGRFGAKVTMDNSPWFDTPDIFDQRRIRVADIDGSGNTDIIYLAAGGVRLYFNQSGNAWSNEQVLKNFPKIDNLATVSLVDLFGDGTACLIWSSPLPNYNGQQMYYINLMGESKPHLLRKYVNNLGAETQIEYASSTKFYLQDKLDGKPWITQLPFPVHVVERVKTFDRISRNHFVTRYAYHHGYFDGVEREFRGFGMVEQWDTETFESFNDLTKPLATNCDQSFYVPPVLTKTWFHTGIYMGNEQVSNFFAGLLRDKDRGEYYREPAWRENNTEAKKRLLEDTILPQGILEANGSYQPYQLSFEEEREACRALKGSMLRQEIYALDNTEKAQHPYTVTEQNFTIKCLQPKGPNQHGIFFTHAREAISYHYERNPEDPRVIHHLTFEVDGYGNVLRSASVGYGRRQPDSSLESRYQLEQKELHITGVENHFTCEINMGGTWRTPLPSEIRTFELTGFSLSLDQLRFTWEYLQDIFSKAIELPYEAKPTLIQPEKRLIEHVRTLYRSDDLSGPLPLHSLQSRALPYESYKLAYTPALLERVFAGRVTDNMLYEGRYVHSTADDKWWIPSGKIFYSPNSLNTSVEELAYAKPHFFLPHCYRNPFYSDTFNTESLVTYDKYDLLIQEIQDAFGNRITVGERDITGNLMRDLAGNLLIHHDYRVLQPKMIMDPNRNRSAVSFDALGLVVGTALMGKPKDSDNPREGDILDDNFKSDLSEEEIFSHLNDPLANPHVILQSATSRLIYDLFAYSRTKNQVHPQPAVVYTIVRETHDADLLDNQQTLIQHQFSYSDGFGREIQRKVQAEPGPIPKRDPLNGHIIINNDEPEMGIDLVKLRWVGSGWTIFNNKGKPVRQYEPFFTDTHQFEFEVCIGVSSVLFYDPLERVIATIHPNHSWEKVTFDPWHQKSWDVNDTALLDPRTDENINGYVQKYFELQPADWKTWLQQRVVDIKNPPEDTQGQNPEQDAAVRTLAHADTPSIIYFDSLGRSFLSCVNNGKVGEDTEQFYFTQVVFDIECNERQVIDAKNRIVMQYDYDMLGNRTRQSSMEAGERWIFNDVGGKALYSWDSRGHRFRFEYDRLRRPIKQFVIGSDATKSDPRIINSGRLNQELLIEETEYGEELQKEGAIKFNQLTRITQHKDSAGIVICEFYDFKGNLRRSNRQVAKDYKNILDWENSIELSDSYSSRTTFDALNRPVTLISPDKSIIRPYYNEANLLERIEVNLRGEEDDNKKPIWSSFVKNIDYNAKGQRILIQYGNNVETRYWYDRYTFRLTQLYTRRGTNFTEDCNNETFLSLIATPYEPPQNLSCGLQNLYYTYDAVGNITHIRDAAQQTIYFKNQVVEASKDYFYDALYRLIKATGREHLGQVGGSPIPHSYNDALRVNLFHPNDGNAMGRYQETYQYDEVGNFIEMLHQGMGTGNPVWSRLYEYLEPSLIESNKVSNRLTRTILKPNTQQPIRENYTYDMYGNMIQMPHLQKMEWDFRNQLIVTQRQAVNVEDTEGNQKQGERTYYVYDASGQRIRKVTELALSTADKPLIKDERIYIGGFEIYRRYGTNAITRETLHIMDDKQCIALVETRTQGEEDKVPKQLIRYQFSNHLGSVSLELDDKGFIISYEEYTPYGSTSYQAVCGQMKISKQYRYTSKERDEESGLYYHGARYYTPWLGRWVSVDPLKLVDTFNLYQYVRNSPIECKDSTGQQTEDTFFELNQYLPEISESPELAEILDTSPPPIPGNTIVTNYKSAAQQGCENFRNNTPMPPGTKPHHFTKVRAAQKTNVPPNIMNENIMPLQSSGNVSKPFSGKAANTLLTDPQGKGTKYFIDEKPCYGNEHTFVDRGITPMEEAKNLPSAYPTNAVVEAGQATRWRITGDGGPGPGKTLNPNYSVDNLPNGSGSSLAREINGAGTAGQIKTNIALIAEKAPEALRVVGFITTGLGAYQEALNTIEFERQHNRGEVNASLMGISALVVGVEAGWIDDVFAIYQEACMGAPQITQTYWDEYGSGPVQHSVGEVIRSLLEYGFSLER